MKKLLFLVIILSLVLSACGQAAPTAAPVEQKPAA